jgi:hypothetical protein
MRALRWYVVLAIVVSGCARDVQGPPVVLEKIAAPPPIKEAPTTTVVAPAPPNGSFAAWVPRRIQPNGDVIEGHLIYLSATPPDLEAIEPERSIPRPPKGGPMQRTQPHTGRHTGPVHSSTTAPAAMPADAMQQSIQRQIQQGQQRLQQHFQGQGMPGYPQGMPNPLGEMLP